MTAATHDSAAPIDLAGAVAVVTGGASGIGRALCVELLSRGGHVVVADIEPEPLAATVATLSEEAHARGSAAGGSVEGRVLDVTSEVSTAELVDHVFDSYGRCNLLFLNAGVTSGGGGLPWQQEPNDWRWCFGVNVVGVGIGVSAFVPAMLASGAPGQVVITSSSDGGIAPVPTASVYAASKAAASCLAESLQHQLIAHSPLVRASVFYPFGGLLDTGLYTAARNRPAELARVGAGTGRAGFTFDELVERVTQASGQRPPIADLATLARRAVESAAQREFMICGDREAVAELLHRRADAVARGELPPPYGLQLSQ